MSPIETQNYETENLIAGPVKTKDDTPLAADTYHRGMPLAFVPTVTPDGSNTGNGVLNVLAGKRQAFDIVLTMTAALIAKLTVNSVDVITGIALPDGGNVIINYNGLLMQLTDGVTAWVADDFVTVSCSTGAYAYDLTNIQNIYSGPDERVLSSAGQGSTIVSGEVLAGGLVDDSGDALTITEGMILNAEEFGIIIKNKVTA